MTIHRLLTRMLLAAGLVASVPFGSDAQSIEVFGQVSAELRGFAEGPGFRRQFSGFQPSFSVTPEVEVSLGSHGRIRFVPFARIDGRDSGRTHWDVRELTWERFGDGWDVTVGLDTVFWGVTESRHLVDVINQTDFAEDLDGEDKLGQPMVSARVAGGWGSLRFFVLPGFRERTFAGESGRPGFPLPIDRGGAIYQSPSRARHVDYAVRYAQYWGDWDLGLSYFQGTGREPNLIPNASGTRFIPYYRQIRQWGVDAQYTRNALLLKLEAIVRQGQGATFGAAVSGFEYTLYGLGGSDIDMGMLFEYQFDGRDNTAPVTPYDDDFFVGTRLALNDTQDSSILAGALIDRNTGTTAVSIEAGRRLGSDWLIELESRLFMNTSPTRPLDAFANDSWATLRLSWFF